ncbi:MAG: hypothetical protein WBC70_01955 [Candidatus Aminicenantales bacterium]
MIKEILAELRRHAPFTAFGAITGIAILLTLIFSNVVSQVSEVSSVIFYILHPTHIVLSAIVTTAMYRLHRPQFNFLWGILIGYVGSIGIATLSDSIVPYLGEIMLDLPNRGVHIGFIEKPWLTHPAAFLGIVIAVLKPTTKFPHAGHVLVSTWASLFHIIMAIGPTMNLISVIVVFVFLFLAVWFPCCLSDIIFPLLFVPASNEKVPTEPKTVDFKTGRK